MSAFVYQCDAQNGFADETSKTIFLRTATGTIQQLLLGKISEVLYVQLER